MNRTIIAIVALILCFSTLSCQKPKVVVEEVKAVPVTVVKPEMKDISVYYTTSATIESDDVRMLSFAVGGRVAEIYVDAGESFKKGDTLARLDQEYFQNGLKAASSNLSLSNKQNNAANVERGIYELQVADAQTEFDDAELQLERYQRLHADGVATDSELEEKQLDFDMAKNHLETAKKTLKLSDGKIATTLDGIDAASAQYDSARQQVSDSVLVAPFDGTISSKFIESSSVVGPGTPVFEVIANGLQRIETSLPERYLNSITEGSELFITVPNNHCDMLPQKISLVHRTIDSMTGNFGVTIVLDDQAGCLQHGMFAQLDFVIDSRTSVMTLPVNCLLVLNDQQIVYVREGDKAMKRAVSIGLESRELVEITSGLTGSEEVILSGNKYIVDDTIIKVVTPEISDAGDTSE